MVQHEQAVSKIRLFEWCKSLG